MNFQLSPEIDSNKVFLVKRSELEGRLDPSYYIAMPKIKALVPLKKIAKINGGKRIPKGRTFSSVLTQYKYLRVEDLSEENINIASLKNISKDIFDILVRYEAKEKDLIISIAGTVGKVIILNNNTNNRVILTENAAKIFLKSSMITVEALQVILRTNLLQKQIQANSIQTTIPKLGLDKILNLKIPIPPKEIQTQIVAKMDDAYTSKKQKEAEAQRLLDSIDGYLLGQLGIELPKQEENNIQSRMFTRQLSEVSGGRFDAPVHKKKYVLKSNKYPMRHLSKCVLINPLTSFYGYSSHTKVTFIPMEKISDQYGEADIF